MEKVSSQNRAGRIFETAADIGSLFMALLYVLYMTLLLTFDVGTDWLNYCMLTITIAYIVFFIVKIFSLNRILTQKRFHRYARITLKYSKWSMKLINAIFVALTLATAQLSDNHVITMIGIMVVGFSFLISVTWDVLILVMRRKIRDLKIGWDKLSTREKNKRIELIISSFVKSLDNITGLDVTQSVTLGAGRLVEERKQIEAETTKVQQYKYDEDDF